MRKLILLGICISFLLPTAMQAQYLRSSYFMEGSSTRIQLNPALQPKRGYVNLPGIGSVNAEVATNSLGIQVSSTFSIPTVNFITTTSSTIA